MPAKAPPLTQSAAERLQQLGERLRLHRRALKISAADTAEAAGVSRVTLHRIERGEPSVTIGAWMTAAGALGLDLAVIDPTAQVDVKAPHDELPDMIRLADFPQLQRLAWHLKAPSVTPEQALALYERNWRHVDHERLDERERRLVDLLARRLRGGRLLV
jgi:transcriptional regulator with XRE-family HTH domain